VRLHGIEGDIQLSGLLGGAAIAMVVPFLRMREAVAGAA
jgi:hypothetical protein